MTSTKKKTGRPQAVYKAGDGTRIPGLTRLSDGRWRVSGPEKHTFTETDERLAIAKFRQYEAKRISGGKEYVNLPVGNAIRRKPEPSGGPTSTSSDANS